MNWLLLLCAGFLEIAWAVGLKYSDGFSRLYPSVFTIIAMIFSVVLLSFAMRGIPLGTAYAIWTGIGATGTAIAGIILFGDSASIPRIISLGLIIAGIIGLKLLSGTQTS